MDEHGVTIAEEAVALSDGFGVGVEDEFAAFGAAGGGEGADEHEEGGFGEVKVGEEGVDDFKLVGRIDEEAGFGGGGNDFAVRSCD